MTDLGPVHRRCLAPLIVLLLFCRDEAGAERRMLDSIKGPVWCVASPKATEAALQKGLNFACGEGGVDCSAIQPGGSCFNPDTIRDHASYAYNSYFSMKPLEYRCDFEDSADFTNTDPSTTTCKYPSTGYAATRNTGKAGEKA